MRKNLMTLILGLLFVFFGTFAAKADASTDKVPNFVKISRSEFNRKIVDLKLRCKNIVGARCDAAIAQADAQATQAWNLCVANINICQDVQNIALNTLEAAMDICRIESQMEYHQSSIKRREDILTESLSASR